jgi:hypothetical protein
VQPKYTWYFFWRSELIVFHLVRPLDSCCDNCIRKQDRTRRFKTIYDLIGFLDTSCGRDPISCPVDNNDSDLGSTVLPKIWGNLRAGKHLTLRRQVLEDWRYNCWKMDYRLCSWGAAGIMPDVVLSKLASFIKIETIDHLLEAVPDWGYASKYGQDVLLLLKDADLEQRLNSQVQRVKTRQENKKRKVADLERDERQQDSREPLHSGSSATPLTLVHTRMLDPIVVAHVPLPTIPLPPRPRPRPRPRPVLVARPYTRTDIFDSIANYSRNM